MPECSVSSDGYHYTNFPPNGFCRYCGQVFGPAKHHVLALIRYLHSRY